MPVGRAFARGKARIASGQRDHLVTVQTKTEAVDDSGFPSEPWVTFVMLHMSREDTTADERMTAGQDSAFVATFWQSAYLESLDPELIDVPATKRLVYRDRVYNIRAATVLERRTGIEFVTLAQVG